MKILKIWLWLWLLSQFSLISAQTTSEQSFYPEAPLEFRNGILFSTQITICFENHSVTKNITDAEKIAGNHIKPGAFKSCITTFCTTRNINLEDICLKRGIPAWPAGMVTVTDMNNGDIKPAVDLSLVYMLRFPQVIEVELLCDVLKKIEGICYAHPPVLIGILATPNDTYYANQWYLPQIQTPQAWDITKGVDTIRIAIIDARAVCQTHPDLQAKIKGGDGQTRTLEYDRHGTMVAGVAAGITNNALGIAGLGWYNEIITYETPTGQTTEDDLLAAKIVQAAQPSQKVRVINLSFHIGKPYNNHYSWCNYKKGIYSTRIIAEGPNGDFPEIESAITNAINSGIIVVAASGNTQWEFYCWWDVGCEYPCPGGIYGPIWPAAYPGVIGVGGTDSSDSHPTGFNYGSHIDVCAPAIGIKSTQPPNGYFTDSGTSFAAPLVTGLVALIKSLNPQLTSSQVENIIESTALDLGTSGWDNYYGYGRINAHAALLKVIDDLAPCFSASSQATAYNNSRKLLKSGSNLYLVYESGNQIYFTNSANDGSTWSNPTQRLSDGYDQHNFPCISKRSDHLYVVWQRKTNTTSYNLLCCHSSNNGNSWENPVTLATGITPASDPLPVIAASTPTADFALLAAYRTTDGLKSRRSTSVNGSSWQSEITVTSNTSARNPSLIYKSNNPPGYFMLTWDDGNNLYHQTFNGTTWSTPAYRINNPDLAANNQYSAYALAGNLDRHIVWQAFDYDLYFKPVIYHNKNLNPTVFTLFANSQCDYLRPTGSGHSNGAFSVVWHDASSNQNIRKAYYNGSSWIDGQAGTIIASNGTDASLSVANPPGATAKAVWRSTGSSPYAVTLGPSGGLGKNLAGENISYQRRIIYAVDSASVLSLQMRAVELVSGANSQELDFPAVNDNQILAATELVDQIQIATCKYQWMPTVSFSPSALVVMRSVSCVGSQRNLSRWL